MLGKISQETQEVAARLERMQLRLCVCKRDREQQLDIYRQRESVESFKEVLFPLNTDSFRLHFTFTS